jgi:hypothetical protein
MLSIHVQIHVIPGHWQQKSLIWCAVRVLVPVVVLWCLAGMQDTTRRAVPTYLVLGRGEVGGTASRSQSRPRRRRRRRRRRRASRRATQRVVCRAQPNGGGTHSATVMIGIRPVWARVDRRVSSQRAARRAWARANHTAAQRSGLAKANSTAGETIFRGDLSPSHFFIVKTYPTSCSGLSASPREPLARIHSPVC